MFGKELIVNDFVKVKTTAELIFLTLCQTAKILDWSKLKAFADDKINVSKILEIGLGRVENIVGKGENAGYQHFLLFHNIF